MAALLVSIPYLIGGLTTPFVGIFVDKIGMKTLFIIFCNCIFILSHLILAFLPQV